MANPVNTEIDNTPLVIKNDGQPPVSYTILTGQDLAAGSVLGIITTGGKLKLVDSASADGSQVPRFVLADAVDSTGGDVTGVRNQLVSAGLVNSDKLVFGGTDTISTHFVALKETGIIAVNPDNLEAFDNV